MSAKKSTMIYRKILREAMSITWKRKSLWFFGIFAGLISTGGVIDVALNSLNHVKRTGTLFENLLDQSFIGYDVFAQYIQQASLLGNGNMKWIVGIFTLILIAVIAAGVSSQAALLKGSKSLEAKHPNVFHKQGRVHFWDIFIVDAITKILAFVLVLISSLPFLLNAIHNTEFTIGILFVQTLIFLPLIIILHIISMLAIIDIVDHGSKAMDAVHTALRLFKHQWAATFEFGVLLFFIVLVAGIALVALVGILMIPYAIIYTSSLLTGSFGFFLFANTVFGGVFLLIVLAFAGMIVTFQYSAWHRFYKRAMHKQLGTKAFAKIIRLFHR